MTQSRPTLTSLLDDLATGRASAAGLAERALAAATDEAGQGNLVFTKLYADAAQATAAHIDQMAKLGVETGPLAGLPISIKDLFDVAGEPTTAGSVVLKDAPPATRDAVIVRRLREAGAVIVGKTNMTEFAFSGLGLNPHYGTPLNAWDRATGRIPGGSSAGAPVSVTDGMAAAGIGTDTGGSVRIPAALNGLAGFKPTARRVSAEGCLPLSFSLDSIGPIAPSIACCALIDAVLAGETPGPLLVPAIGRLRFGVLRNFVMDGVDATVAAAYSRALTALSKAGAVLTDITLPVLDRLPEIHARGTLAGAEAWAWHRELIGRKQDGYDPRVAVRILGGSKVSAADYIDLLAARAAAIAEADADTADFDAILLPTVPLVAPAIADLASDAEFGRVNLLMLRNPTAGNFLDRCAATVPCHVAGEAPVGLMVMGPTLGDRRLLAVAAAVEAVVSL